MIMMINDDNVDDFKRKLKKSKCDKLIYCLETCLIN